MTKSHIPGDIWGQTAEVAWVVGSRSPWPGPRTPLRISLAKAGIPGGASQRRDVCSFPISSFSQPVLLFPLLCQHVPRRGQPIPSLFWAPIWPRVCSSPFGPCISMFPSAGCSPGAVSGGPGPAWLARALRRCSLSVSETFAELARWEVVPVADSSPGRTAFPPPRAPDQARSSPLAG